MTMIDQAHIRALTDILGDKGIVEEPGAMVAYQTGARYDEGLAGLVLRPATTEEASAAVAYGVRHGLLLVSLAVMVALGFLILRAVRRLPQEDPSDPSNPTNLPDQP